MSTCETTWVLVDDVGDGVDQLDDQLGHAIAGRRLAAEDHRARRASRGAGATLEPVVERDQVQHVQVLALVFVQPLHLDVEERLRIDADAGSLLDERGQRALVVGLDRLPLALETAVGGQRLEARELVLQVGDPAVADVPGDQRAQLRIAQHHPAPRRHAVGDVDELVRRHRVEVAQHRLLEQLGVQRGDAVDGVAADAAPGAPCARTCSPRLVDQRQPPSELIVAGMALPHIVEEAAVDLVDDLEVARQQLARTAAAAISRAPRQAACGSCSRTSAA